MHKLHALFALSLSAVALVGCSDDDDNSVDEPVEMTTGHIRIFHAASDAPKVNITANGSILNDLEGVDYQIASARFDVETGTYDVAVEAQLPGDTTAEVLSADLTVDMDMNYDIFAVGSVADDSLDLLTVTSSETEVASGNAQVQIVHAASSAPTVDIYVTAPETALSSEQPTVTASFTDFTDLLQVPAGDYQIRITPAGSMDVVYDSGTVNLADGADLVIAATNNTGTGDAPVTLLVADGTSSALLWDAEAPADLRVVHGISDAPAVDVVVNNNIVLVDGLAFPNTTDYVSVAPDTYLVDVVADADNSIVAVDDAQVTLEVGQSYTAIANNLLAAPELDLLMDMPRRVATAAQVRIVHASPAAGDVDIYVTGDGNITDVMPTFSAVPYSTDALAETGYVSLEAGSYVVSVTAAGSKEAVIETGVLNLEANMIYTAIAADGAMTGDLPQLILLDDFNN